jgi:uncharacterized protein YraI
MSRQACLVAALLLATPAAALAAPGVITSSVNLRAGPSVEFPVVNRLPRGVPVEIHGCIRQELWCDVSWQRERGWVAARYLDYFYNGRYVDLPSYVDVVDVPATSFVLTSYWSSFYFGRPWYRRHAWWHRHWNAQTHVAAQTPGMQPAAAPARMGTAMTSATMSPAATPPAAGMRPAAMGMTATAPAMGRAQAGTPAVASVNQGMTAPAMQGRERFSSGMRPAMTSGGMGPANAMRGGGMPMAARAQVSGSRGGPAGGMPHTAMGGASQGGGAMHNGGGGGGRDGGGHHRH